MASIFLMIVLLIMQFKIWGTSIFSEKFIKHYYMGIGLGQKFGPLMVI